ncbi:hypothetical protein QBC37DRAFT_393662 [Rhypophila decipiens]|uniref:C2H2-type domain-containing protein n=1 Tax=Rhypophila decipiens TaxID=261697 RepID=A0AAN7B2N3_9PEZI|nr:hypothetical protein QBC37DRAFT_393662 [Rhypophila decipiens]
MVRANIPGSKTLLSRNNAAERRANIATNNYELAELDDADFISEVTREQRENAWKRWIDFCDCTGVVDPDSIFIRLCLDDKAAVAKFQDFLDDYVKFSEQYTPTLGPEEYIVIRSVKHSLTVLALWKALLMAAHDKVLKTKRLEDPQNAEVWRLKRHALNNHRSGPVKRISDWIAGDLSNKYNLNREQRTVKREATAEDVMMVLDTLWSRAADIPCEPRARVAFHSLVILCSLGFRGGVTMNFCYKDVELQVVRGLDDAKSTLFARLTLHHNKQKQNIIRRRQDHIVEIGLFPVPCQLICLVSQIALRSIADDAFKHATFTSLEDLVERPVLEDQDAVTLEWKDEMLDKPIFPLAYHHFRDLWHQVWFVAGNRDTILPYSLRVGAGGNYDGVLTSTVRNYVLGHTSDMFRKSYQPRQLRMELLPIIFGPQNAGNQQALYQRLHRASCMRDENAPIYPTSEDFEMFERRKDVAQLRNAYDEVRKELRWDDPKAKHHKANLTNLLRNLQDLAVDKRRKEYFAEADRRRQCGQGTMDLRKQAPEPIRPHTRGKSGHGAAAAIGQFLQQQSLGGARRWYIFGDMLLAYLKAQHSAVEIAYKQHAEVENLSPSEHPRQNWICLLCSRGFSQRAHLTRHNTKNHIKIGTFNQPFSCPECKRIGQGEHKIQGAAQWSNHTEQRHGRFCTPNVPAAIQPAAPAKHANRRSIECFACRNRVGVGVRFSNHIKQHFRGPRSKLPFCCLVCAEEGITATIEDRNEWDEHLTTVHGCHSQTGMPQNEKQKACDSCFGLKHRCSALDGKGTCQRCLRNNRTCVFSERTSPRQAWAPTGRSKGRPSKNPKETGNASAADEAITDDDGAKVAYRLSASDHQRLGANQDNIGPLDPAFFKGQTEFPLDSSSRISTPEYTKRMTRRSEAEICKIDVLEKEEHKKSVIANPTDFTPAPTAIDYSASTDIPIDPRLMEMDVDGL